tara:strand:- start:21 stop:740 length:720 start_codon:yes stop_codon:yes gene_type:complete
MVLPSSGSLSYNTIRAEFGSPSSNVYLSLYYRGGPYTYAIPANANITTSSTGTIAVNDFYGADNKGPYASFSGGSHNTGGKAPNVYYGAGGPSLPGMSDTSLTIGGTGYTINRFYVFSTGTSMMITGSPDSNITSAPTWSQRNFYGYNSSGGLAFQFRTGWAAGRGQQPTPVSGITNQSPRPQANPGSTWVYDAVSGYPGGTFVLYTDFYLSQAAGQPGPSFVSGGATDLAQYITVKAN